MGEPTREIPSRSWLAGASTDASCPCERSHVARSPTCTWTPPGASQAYGQTSATFMRSPRRLEHVPVGDIGFDDAREPFCHGRRQQLNVLALVAGVRSVEWR